MTPPPRTTTPPAARTGRPWVRVKNRVIRRDGGICHLCGQPGADSADHLTPVSAGGAVYDLTNLAAVHDQPCNRIRGTRPVAEVRAELTGHAGHTNRTDHTWAW